MSSEVVFTIDPEDIICSVNDAFWRFADENDGMDLKQSAVIGRHLLSFVSGDVTQMFVRTMLQAARLREQAMTRPYRCDSPAIRREMEMRLIPEERGFLTLRHTVIKETPIIPAIRFKTDITVPRTTTALDSGAQSWLNGAGASGSARGYDHEDHLHNGCSHGHGSHDLGSHGLGRHASQRANADFVSAVERIKRCSMCNRVRINGFWMEADDAVKRRVLDAGRAILTFYGICPDCSATKTTVAAAAQPSFVSA